ncbi:unnamed protein product [Protopolystoma xenopodis]|uniref:Uncharacterized protein n=1 Tax=Protopolystoma xenopodis TaxID=117903 RepID=A0A448WQ08_9PLAT|nr:unnamed protein product [Protopolystoma xenopodis]
MLLKREVSYPPLSHDNRAPSPPRPPPALSVPLTGLVVHLTTGQPGLSCVRCMGQPLGRTERLAFPFRRQG